MYIYMYVLDTCIYMYKYTFIMNNLRIIEVALKVREFWLNHKDRLPTWFAAYQNVLLLQPSGAASVSFFYSQQYFQ